jgi:aryl-alcohol dehydrogenase-like predicted oxidoreductase
MAFVPFAPLGSAFRGGPARLAGDQAIVRVADKHGATPSQIALAWLLARYDRMLLIPGTSSVTHLAWLRSSSSSMTAISPPSIVSSSATTEQSEG